MITTLALIFTGDYQLASQQGMAMGGVRHAADMKTSQPDMKGHGILSRQTGEMVKLLQCGNNKQL